MNKISFYGWKNCPSNVKNQIFSLMEMVIKAPEISLVGVYLHGSLAMGCFNQRRSDLDLLVVTEASLTLEAKYHIIKGLLALSGDPCPVEVSFLCQSNLSPWEFPTPFDLHFSEMWREGYQKQLENGEWETWNEVSYRDPDLAAHITILFHRGICLWGKPVAEVFPEVPSRDYQASILLDYHDSREKIDEKPMYAVLTFCRVYAYLVAKEITSKQEGALWGMENFPGEFRKLIGEVLAIYEGDMEEKRLNLDLVKKFDGFINQKITCLLKEEVD